MNRRQEAPFAESIASAVSSGWRLNGILTLEDGFATDIRITSLRWQYRLGKLNSPAATEVQLQFGLELYF